MTTLTDATQYKRFPPDLATREVEEIDREAASAIAVAGGELIVFGYDSWTTPNGASGWDYAYYRLAGGKMVDAHGRWEILPSVASQRLNAVFGSSGSRANVYFYRPTSSR